MMDQQFFCKSERADQCINPAYRDQIEDPPARQYNECSTHAESITEKDKQINEFSKLQNSFNYFHYQ